MTARETKGQEDSGWEGQKDGLEQLDSKERMAFFVHSLRCKMLSQSCHCIFLSWIVFFFIEKLGFGMINLRYFTTYHSVSTWQLGYMEILERIQNDMVCAHPYLKLPWHQHHTLLSEHTEPFPRRDEVNSHAVALTERSSSISSVPLRCHFNLCLANHLWKFR